MRSRRFIAADVPLTLEGAHTTQRGRSSPGTKRRLILRSLSGGTGDNAHLLGAISEHGCANSFVQHH